VDVRVIGTSHDPHFAGSVNIVNAGFLATATGARYKNGRAAITLARERVTVDTLHIEDNDGHPLEVRGSLATHELRVGDLEIEAHAAAFRGDAQPAGARGGQRRAPGPRPIRIAADCRRRDDQLG
jgi:autotransporter translocation and assembly factor TamB